MSASTNGLDQLRARAGIRAADPITPDAPCVPTEGVHGASPAQSKIALFRSLFRGREDVYPRRFESLRTGKSGYAPACANEWRLGVCEKPRIKCAVCPNRQFLPVTDEVIRWHLTGADDAGASFTMGVYPMLLDETCHLLAVDFDGETWTDDASAYLSTCTRRGVPAALERSRSGNGGHVWLFFDAPAAAGLARRLGALLLTETMDNRPDLGFRSYDRFFPSQDTLPHGGFGNLIALPLQGKPRKSGNSVFVDTDLNPLPDQWAYLSQLGRVPASQAESLVREAEKDGRVLGVKAVESDELLASAPWNAPPSRRPRDPPVTGPLPDTVDVVLGDGIYIAKQDLPPGIVARLMRLAAFQNPEFYRAQAMRLPTWGKRRIVDYVEDGPKFIRLPRGCLDDAGHLLRRFGIKPSIDDQRHPGTPVSVSFQATLRPEQQMAASAMLAHDTGILAATTAFGKTVVAAWLIAQRGVNTLILVHRKQLMEQWTARLCEFLDITEREIGRLGGGRRKLKGRIDIATIQSLIRHGEVDDRIYSISLPASAAPGWPAAIPLPADGSWKHRYGASVRRLLRDGVDEPLADLFTQVASEIPSGAQGAERARSASEAFLFRRLQSLPETRDRFRVNERLPIPFSEDGRMEVDFLDPASRLVLELDGAQHLADREAYRRDRRKDALLQEHGYLVLRFLAEDLGTRLDAVLDEVLRALAGRTGRSGTGSGS